MKIILVMFCSVALFSVIMSHSSSSSSSSSSDGHECRETGEQCNDAKEKFCCPSLKCNNEKRCIQCALTGLSCNANTPCCDDEDSCSGTCCRPLNKACNATTPCCAGLQCNGGICQNCAPTGQSCTEATAPNCCSGLCGIEFKICCDDSLQPCVFERPDLCCSLCCRISPSGPVCC
ncbi:keratin-associated protein 5-1-like [Sitodiplosis mosellana]|uniref:keratin-associated protein 5-1-like n=1 Tax=Sitodiplosis mosellana TaxID=263140 RepID=UPI002443CDC2|nr:keratin-associated protein 5-1-like [Sitodiplosis mosellana]